MTTAENQYTDVKSLRVITGKSPDWPELAKDCVCFANSQGGRILIGIEEEDVLPSAGQTIPVDWLDRLRKRIGELTVNVQVLPRIVTAENGGQFIELSVSRAVGVASTSDGRYYLRVADTCRPVVGDDVLRLANERPGLPWESMKTNVLFSRGCFGGQFRPLTKRWSGNCWSTLWSIGRTPSAVISFSVSIPIAWKWLIPAACPSG